jgi:hypothetical protein
MRAGAEFEVKIEIIALGSVDKIGRSRFSSPLS